MQCKAKILEVLTNVFDNGIKEPECHKKLVKSNMSIVVTA